MIAQPTARKAHRTPSLGYRPDIEGLRGIAVTLVVAFHCGLPGFAGGFIGVDVFFVLSGYLITGLLVAEIEKTSRLSLIQFYARRVRRLLPASALTLLTILLVGAVILAPYELEFAGRAARASALYMSNIFFAREAADYFSPNVETNPVLHTWSLAVEEQFYLFWPLLLMLGLQFGRSRKALVTILSAVTVVSLAASVWYTGKSGPVAFYELPSRAWEFGLGGLAVLYKPAGSRPSPSPDDRAANAWRVLGWLGVLVIFASGAFVISSQSAFPGWIALVPVAGTAIALIAVAQQATGGAATFLGSWVMQRLGNLSYSWYLWHWPFLVFAAALFPNIGIAGRTAAALLALAVAAIAHHFIENPIRYYPWLVARPAVSLALAGVVTAFTVTCAFGSLWVSKRLGNQPEMKALTAAADDIADMPREKCVSLAESPEVKTCVFGNESAAVNIALFGDSHAIQWFNPLRSMVEMHGWKLTTFVKSGCPATDITPPRSSAAFAAGCSQWRAEAIRRIGALHSSLVFVANATNYIERRGRPSTISIGAWGEGMKRTLQALSAQGLQVAVMRDNPLSSFDIPTCVARTRRHSWYAGGSCEMEKAECLRPAIFEAEKSGAQGLASVHFIDLTDQYCQGDVCQVLRNGEVMYRDDNHLTGTFAGSLCPVLEARLISLLMP